MAENLSAAPKSKKSEFMRAILDLFILALLIGGAGLGGYWYGLHERVVPVEWVPKGSEGAVDQSVLSLQANAKQTPTAKTDNSTVSQKKPAAPVQANKYWLTSSGTDFMGYSITVSVNGDQVDGFFGPGKIVDITSKIKPGDNTILFDCKQLGDEYNKHPGDNQAELVVKLVSGSKIHEDFKDSDVKITYKRNASEKTDFRDTKHFTAK